MLLVPILNVIDILLSLYQWVVIISVIMSWLVQFNIINMHNRFVYMVGSTLNQMVEPALRLIRRYLPTFGNIDLSPIVLLLAIYLVRQYLGMLAVSLVRGS